MNFIAKYLPVIGLLLLTAFVAAAACLYFDVPARLQKPGTAPGDARKTYTCPMHLEVVQDYPGTCPQCGMSLVPASSASKEAHPGCERQTSGCCAKSGAATWSLPPGHPPVEGYTVSASAECTNHLH